MFGLGTWELILILAVLLLLFGSKKLPELAAGIGKSVKALKRELKNKDEEPEVQDKKDDDKPSSSST